MSSAFANKLSVAILLLFVASLGAWSFNVKRLAHELGHGMARTHLADVEPVHVHSLLEFASSDHHECDGDHELLHAGGQIQPCPMPAFDWPQPLPAGVTETLFVSPPVAHPTREPPFRPPRGTSALA